ncbi:hypothetical protein B5V02_27815 [Mesorhizobium kowhaii]|uniref:Metallo-beta-lactamase domain-containing protein n=2 Tax=Mesorhizobium kowhaii TaxID=1300272 RepID=A0A2W7BVI9_9HYPH|nr:hypothetical protein B5V02_27815 [Mesorhizobium kowhaii]
MHMKDAKIDEAAKARVAEMNVAAAASNEFDWADLRDFEDARRGLLRDLPDLVIKDEAGRIVWDSRPHDLMLAKERPDTVHPSLWRLAQLNNIRGLFEVADGVWQTRGHSLANMTFVAGETGWIVIDPANTVETARVGLELANMVLGRRPVVGVVYSHTHSDHWGGAKGVDPEPNARVVAPAGFEAFVLAESLVASEGLAPRNNYMYGEHLGVGPYGHVDCGLGKATEGGKVSYLPPTDHIGREGGRLTIDGVDFLFQHAPGEAPAGMHVYLPASCVLHVADNCYASLHNVYTIRGSLSRDASLWSDSVDRALQFVNAEVVIGGHHWPRWGQKNVRSFIAQQRDALKFMHDQAARMMKLGYSAHEIASMVELPPSLARQWHLRGYYGTVSQNVRAIVQHYLGWYDGSPATLNSLPPREAAAKMIDYMGGIPNVLKRARDDLNAGNFRWVVQILDHVLWLDPHCAEARSLAAVAHRTLGYTCENATWRNAHLSAAKELAGDVQQAGAIRDSADLSTRIPLRALFDYLAIRVIGAKAATMDILLSWQVTDTEEEFTTHLNNGVLNLVNGVTAEVKVALTRDTLTKLIYEQVHPTKLPMAITGDRATFDAMWSVMETFPDNFSIAGRAFKIGERSCAQPG